MGNRLQINRDHNRVLTGAYRLNHVAYLDETAIGALTELAVYVGFNMGTTGGLVVLEGGPYRDYEGEWAPLQRIPWTGEGKCAYAPITGAHLCVRIRIEAPILGANGVDVWVAGA